MRGRLVTGGNAAPFRLEGKWWRFVAADRVEKAVTDLARYSRPAFARSAHRTEMEWASLEAFAPPRYYVTRSGMPARPWRLERVSLGKAEAVAAFRTHAEAIAEAERWVRDDYAGRRRLRRLSDRA